MWLTTSPLLLLCFSLLSHLSPLFHLPLFLSSVHVLSHFQPSFNMRRQSWSNTWSRSRSSRLTSSWKRSRRWKMKPFQSNWPWNRYVYPGTAGRWWMHFIISMLNNMFNICVQLFVYYSTVRCTYFIVLNFTNLISNWKDILVFVCWKIPHNVHSHDVMMGILLEMHIVAVLMNRCMSV